MEFKDPEACDDLITAKVTKVLQSIYRKKLFCRNHPTEEVINYDDVKKEPRCAVCIYEEN